MCALQHIDHNVGEFVTHVGHQVAVTVIITYMSPNKPTMPMGQ